MTSKRGALSNIVARVRRIIRENRERNREARDAAIFDVADAIHSMMQRPWIDNSGWDDAYRSEINRIYKKAIPRSIRPLLDTHQPVERNVYGVSIDGSAITALGRRTSKEEAQRLAIDEAVAHFRESGTTVKKISLHRRGLRIASWHLIPAEDWTSSETTGHYDAAGGKDKLPYWAWTDHALPTLFSRTKNGEYVQLDDIGEEVVEMDAA